MVRGEKKQKRHACFHTKKLEKKKSLISTMPTTSTIVHFRNQIGLTANIFTSTNASIQICTHSLFVVVNPSEVGLWIFAEMGGWVSKMASISTIYLIEKNYLN